MLGVERSSTGVTMALLATLGRNPEYVGNAMATPGNGTAAPATA